ncbi:MAG: peptidase M22 [Ruminococcaceae bacterium]|nr:peptidase M22 [Oscillospiraceae bacterium]
MTPCFVGFDTSNYTTSVAVCDREGRILANLKEPLPVGKGARGLRQSDAVFAHVRNLPTVCEKLKETLAKAGLTPTAVGVSTRPRDAEGSYMPCFLAGRSAAYAFAAQGGLPVYDFSHQNGHVMAALYSCGEGERLMQDRFLAFHVSGGTTEVLLADARNGALQIELVGETDDLNGGQLIDRVGVAMGLSFPCGGELEHLATAYEGKPYRHPVCVRNGRCSLSGAENIALRLWKETNDREAVAAFVFDFLAKTLIAMGEQIQEKYGRLPVLFAGGVMSNQLMRQSLGEQFDACFAEPEFSADNAAGIALLCRRATEERNG